MADRTKAMEALAEYRDKRKAEGLSARGPSKFAGLSRKRAMRAFCYECLGGTTRLECTDVACPLHVFYSNKVGDSVNWFMEPAHRWNELSQVARGGIVKADNDPDIEDDDMADDGDDIKSVVVNLDDD